jgi:hypothetical protein
MDRGGEPHAGLDLKVIAYRDRTHTRRRTRALCPDQITESISPNSGRTVKQEVDRRSSLPQTPAVLNP